MRIGIFVYLIPIGKSGGVQQYTEQLVYALSKYANDKLVIFCSEENKELFEKYKSDKTSVTVLPRRSKYIRMLTNNRYIRQSRVLYFLSRIIFYNRYSQKLMDRLGDYKNMIEKTVDVIHFPYQALDRYDFKIPTIISLHDLQHKIYPNFFTKKEIKKRDTYYKKSAELCTRIMVSFECIKNDIVNFYKINPEKIDICGLGYDKKVFINADIFPKIQEKYNIPQEYILYPAVTWEHKNHIRLMQAFKILHDKFSKKIHLVCTGSKNDFYLKIKEEIEKLNLDKYVIFTGYLPEQEFNVVLNKARAVVIPTLYEAESIPLIEAMAFGVPVVCSSVTVLPEQIGDGRFIFDPLSPDDMADKIYKIISDKNFIDENIKNSAMQVENIRWNKKINNFINSYKKALVNFYK